MTLPLPRHSCNLLLEGGVTSGIVYPALITTLAKAYRFNRVGGTSAGAIGAALAAAAEYARGAPDAHDGLAVIDRLTTELGRGVNGHEGPLLLQALFQPAPRTRATFDLLSSGLSGQGPTHVPLRALRQRPLAAVLGALPGLSVMALARGVEGPLAQPAGQVLGGALAAVGAVTAALAGSAVQGKRALEATTFGLCPGRTAPGAVCEGLTDWLTRAIDEVAGPRMDAGPLTFGDLEDRGVTLRMMTTCLTLGRPYSLPFDNNLFYFQVDEMRALFPETVVEHLVAARRSPSERETALHTRLAEKGIYPLPEGRRLPVVVGVRLSLSFPLLISAVRLYAVDYARAPTRPGDDVSPVLFTDGGLSSNLPLHFFDTALPGCPTFAVNLRSFSEGQVPSADEAENVWLPGHAGQGRQPEFRSVTSLGAFGTTILDTARNWKDGLYVTAPGYRDRIVHVHLDGRVEGGLNLNMTPATVERLVERGRAAALALMDKYAEVEAWNRHRRVRLVNLLTAVAELADEYRDQFTADGEDTPWEDILAARNLGYPFVGGEYEAFKALSDTLIEVGAAHLTMRNRPRPEQRLRLTLDP